MTMALGLQLTAQPRCTLGYMVDGEKEEGREGRRKRATEGDSREKHSRGDEDEKERKSYPGCRRMNEEEREGRKGRRRESGG